MEHNTPDDMLPQPPPRTGTRFATITSLQTELRTQRKHLLGSYASLRALIFKNSIDSIDEERRIHELCDVLSQNTIIFWNHTDEKAIEFCYRFYDIVIRSIVYGRIGGESLDDIIRLAECLVRSTEVFEIVIKQLLPQDRIGDLFHFTEEYEASYYAHYFSDAVLGAVALYLGALERPDASDEHSEAEE